MISKLNEEIIKKYPHVIKLSLCRGIELTFLTKLKELDISPNYYITPFSF